MPSRPRLTFYALACGVLTALSVQDAHSQGVSANRRPKTSGAPMNTKTLDIQADKLEADFLRGLTDLAREYEAAGDLDKAKEMLRAVLKIRPDLDSVKSKLKEIDESVFRENDTVLDVDAAKNWTSAGVIVMKDEPFRIEAAGTYKFILNEDVGPDGFRTEDVTRDQVASLPNGALIGMIAPVPVGGKRNQKEKPEAFLVGSGTELKPERDGLLFLKLNVPPSAKCIGHVKVKISGHIQKIGG